MLPYLQVCNHPDLFEGRQIMSAFDMPSVALHMPSCIVVGVQPSARESINLAGLGLYFNTREPGATWEAEERERLQVGYGQMAKVCGARSWDATTQDASVLMRSAASVRMVGFDPTLPANLGVAGPGPGSLATRQAYR